MVESAGSETVACFSTSEDEAETEEGAFRLLKD
jgi:hypothetical protein